MPVNDAEAAYRRIEQTKTNNIDYLDIADFKLAYVPEQIFDLKNLRVLKLGGLFSAFFPHSRNTISNIPAAIKRLENLIELYLESNRLSTLPPQLTCLYKLETLVLAQNEFDIFPAEVCSLKNLKRLHLNNNRIKEVSHFVSGLSSLKKLYLSSNSIETLPESFYELEQLLELRLNNNRLCRLSPQISKLEKLQELHLNRNNLKELPSEIEHLHQLKELHIEHNEIKFLPAGIASLPELKVIRTAGNPLVMPPSEICELGIEAIKQWFKSIEDPANVIKLYEAKLMLIGNGRVGKTTLKENLINRDYKLTGHKSTSGIEVRKWNFQLNNHQTCNVNVWDFGGQGEYRAIQQFFCSRNSLYLFVTQPEDDHIHLDDRYVGFEYWLNFINIFSSNTNSKCPVIFVHTKSDIGMDQFSSEQLKQKFPNINAFINISCKTGEGLEELTELIRVNLEQLGIIGIPFNVRWVEVKKKLDSIDKDYITYDEYLAICSGHGMSVQDADIWLGYLSSSGSILHFSKNLFLRKIIIINPNWVRKAAYNILEFGKKAGNRGKFSREDLKVVWKDHKQEDFHMLLAVMHALRLFYKEKEGDKVIYRVPALCPKTSAPTPFLKRTANSVLAKAVFNPVLPADIIPQLVVNDSDKVFQNLYWNTEAVFHQFDTYAHLVEHWRDKSIIVRINGRNTVQMLDFIMSRIQHVLYQIQGSILFRTIDAEMHLVCNCESCLTHQEPALYNYDYLKKIYSLGNTQLYCPRSNESVNVAGLMQL